jgi:hypothetical protein
MQTQKERNTRLTSEQFVSATEALLREYEASQAAFAERATALSLAHGEPDHFEAMCEGLISMTREAQALTALSSISEGEGLLSFGTQVPSASDLKREWCASVEADCRIREHDPRLAVARSISAAQAPLAAT